MHQALLPQTPNENTCTTLAMHVTRARCYSLQSLSVPVVFKQFCVSIIQYGWGNNYGLSQRQILSQCQEGYNIMRHGWKLVSNVKVGGKPLLFNSLLNYTHEKRPPHQEVLILSRRTFQPITSTGSLWTLCTDLK